MITMEMFGKIRRMYFRDNLSLHEIAKRTGLSRNTIRKWLRNSKDAAPPVYRRREKPGKLTPFHEALEQALKADAHRARQDRRTAKDLFSHIKADGYTGGYSQITAFIRDMQGRASKGQHAFVPLKFELGEAFQFDWSEEGLVIGGIYRRIQVSHLKLCASHDRPTERDQICYDWQHYITLLERKPGALRNGAPFIDIPMPLKQLMQEHGSGVGGRPHGRA